MTSPTRETVTSHDAGRSSTVAVVLAWLAVGIPLAWGVAQPIVKSMALLR